MRVGSNPTASTFSIFFSWAHGPIPALLTFILDFGGLPDAGLLELGLNGSLLTVSILDLGFHGQTYQS